MKNHFVLKSIGADSIMPIILFELNERKKQGVDVDLAEAYVLLNDTQALYLAIAENNRDHATGHYAHIEPKIRALLRKYKLSWVLDSAQLKDYAMKYLVAQGFSFLGTKVLSHPTGTYEATTYDTVLVKALITGDGVTEALVEIGFFKVERRDGEAPQLPIE